MKQFLSSLHKKYKLRQRQTHQVSDSLLKVNFDRLSLIGYVAIPVHILAILLFWDTPTVTSNEVIWRNGIILSHGILMVFMIGLILVTHNLPAERRTRKVMLIIQWVSLAVILFAGVIIVTLDQIVTPNVTPFLDICTITAMAYLLRPIQAVIVYVVIFGSFAWAIGITQIDQAILLSNRVNGISAIGIAIALSTILWRASVVTKLQEQQLLFQQKELEDKNGLLEQYAFYDMLTGLYNRRIFYEMIAKEQAKMQRDGTQAVLFLLDVDQFKQVNDLYGHPSGDIVLAKIGEILTTRLRKGDLISRWGGEEFLCCLLDTKLSETCAVADELRTAIAEVIFEQTTEKFSITVSVGVSLLDPTQGVGFEQAYQKADQALYAAKSAGRNRVEICDNLEKLLLD